MTLSGLLSFSISMDVQIAVKRREVKRKGEKERYTHLNAEFQRTAAVHGVAKSWTQLSN